MHHLPVQMRPTLLARAAGQLSPGGLVIYKDMTSESWRSIANWLHDFALAGHAVRYTPLMTIERWGRETGLEVVHESVHNRMCYGHELLVFRKPAQQTEPGSAQPEIVVRARTGLRATDHQPAARA